jgi:predicted nucleic acid-binding protein
LRGYLLDNNHIEAYFRQVPSVIAKIRSIPADWPIMVSNITMGEIAAGHLMTHTTNPQKRDDYNKFLIDNFLHRSAEVSYTTRIYYARIMGTIWRLHAPGSNRIRTERHLVDLGVDINDVWTVAIAWEHNLIFVTTDAITCIREAVEDNVTFECWL